MEKILILGGTNFIGRNLVESLISRDKYELTLFNRGLTNEGLFPELSQIKGDRYSDKIIETIQQDWDYIIDISCYYPSSLEKICPNISSKLKRYIFISTCSVYDNTYCQDLLRKEDSPILPCTIEERNNTEDLSYGNRKAECERILEQSGVNYSILRPALVYGKYDPTDRFYYWLYQVKKHDTLLLPKNGRQVFSTTYVIDLVNAILELLRDKNESAIYNAISKPETSIEEIILATATLLNKEPKLVSLNNEQLSKNNIQQWLDFPLWLDNNYHTYDNENFKDLLGVNKTPFLSSLQTTIDYFDRINWPEPTFGINEEKRQFLLKLVS